MPLGRVYALRLGPLPCDLVWAIGFGRVAPATSRVTRQGMELSITTGVYVATALGAVALFMMMPRRGGSVALGRLGGLLGAVTLGGIWLFLSATNVWAAVSDAGLQAQFIYFYIFSAIAIVSAVRVITHHKPVYSALWFIMVVLASSGLMLTLNALFMSLAVVIIYGGAILVTYMFVIMLASRSSNPQDESDVPEYEVQARDPLSAVMVGFLLLAMILSVTFKTDLEPNPKTQAPSDEIVLRDVLQNRGPSELVESADVPAERREELKAALVSDNVSNVERVGLELFQSYPLGIELAGVVLLLSLVGAVVFARQRVSVESQGNEKGGQS